MRDEKTILQNSNNTKIKEEFRARKSDMGYWKLRKTSEEYNKQKINEAQNEIFKALLKYVT